VVFDPPELKGRRERERETLQITHFQPNTTPPSYDYDSELHRENWCSIDGMDDGAAAAPASRFRTICVFCGSNAGRRKVFGDAALELGDELVSMMNMAAGSSPPSCGRLAMPRSFSFCLYCFFGFFW
jgi:hypothetical protein